MLISLLSFLKKPNGSYTVGTYSLRKPLQWVERSLLPKRPKFRQHPIYNCYNGYMENNNNTELSIGSGLRFTGSIAVEFNPDLDMQLSITQE